jgi:hypothetical protein
MSPTYPPDREADGRRMLDAHLHLLDRQVLDTGSVPVTAVSDLEISDLDAGEEIPPGTAPPRIEALLSGPVFATRAFGGRPPASRLHRIAWSDVHSVDVVVRLRVRWDSLEASWGERWVRDRIIGRIPGAHHDPQ